MDIIDQAQHQEELWREQSLALRPAPCKAIFKGELRDCTDCGEPINPKRLAAMPNAKRCIDCETLAEKRNWYGH